jgi:hypothetical protein
MPVSEAVGGAFRLAMLPIRLTALAILWATASPTRLIVASAVCTVIAIFI